MIQTKLENTLRKTLKHKHIFGVIARVESGTDDWSWSGAAGNLTVGDQYFIASTTKLYTTAIIFRLRSEGLLQLDDVLTKYVSDELLSGIHVFKGKDYSHEITIRHLLSQTSGIADYFLQKRVTGKSLEQSITAGQDQSWTFEDVLMSVKHMPAAFPPGKKGKALYSDTNYQLLGHVIEVASGKNYEDALQHYVFSRLHLENTYLYTDINDGRPADINYKSEPLHIPKAMSSFGPDGGIVSTAKESMIFLKAFFNGGLFPAEYINELGVWNRIFFPLEYGLGVMHFRLPRIFSGFRPFPEYNGHSGLSGAFAYYCPAKGLYFTGTVNQIAKPGTLYKMMMQLSNAIR